MLPIFFAVVNATLHGGLAMVFTTAFIMWGVPSEYGLHCCSKSQKMWCLMAANWLPSPYCVGRTAAKAGSLCQNSALFFVIHNRCLLSGCCMASEKAVVLCPVSCIIWTVCHHRAVDKAEHVCPDQKDSWKSAISLSKEVSKGVKFVSDLRALLLNGDTTVSSCLSKLQLLRGGVAVCFQPLYHAQQLVLPLCPPSQLITVKYH